MLHDLPEGRTGARKSRRPIRKAGSIARFIPVVGSVAKREMVLAVVRV